MTVLARYKKRSSTGYDELQSDVAAFAVENAGGGFCYAMGIDLGRMSSDSHKNTLVG